MQFLPSWHPSVPDKSVPMYLKKTSAELPAHVDWRTFYHPHIQDQGTMCSATVCVAKYAYEYTVFFASRGSVHPENISVLYSYYYARLLAGHALADSSVSFADVLHSMQNYGACPESLWPTFASKMDVRPSILARQEAQQHGVHRFERVEQYRQNIYRCLSEQHVILAGVAVYDSFLSDHVIQTGIVPYPMVEQESFQGGTAICLVGYDMVKCVYYALAPFGKTWGNQGSCTIPFGYIEDSSLAGDFWSITEAT